MAPNYNRFAGRGLPNGAQQGFSMHPDSIAGQLQTEFFVQQDIGQQALSPDEADAFGRTFSASPTPTRVPPTTHQSNSPQPHARPQHPGNIYSIDMSPSASSPVSAQYQHIVSGAPDLFGNGMGYGDTSAFGLNHPFGPTASLTSLQLRAPSSRAPAVSVGHTASLLQPSLPQFSPSQISASINTPLLPPPSRSAQTRPQHPRGRGSDEVIGYVLADKKKFKCPEPECKDSTFGRLADLRRHHEQQHARNRTQYYCPVSGCSRSHASGGGRGRSFGTRKDKRDEHIRNVHRSEEANAQDVPEQPFSPARF